MFLTQLLTETRIPRQPFFPWKQPKMFSCVSLFVIYLMSPLHGLRVSGSDSHCSVKPVLTPSRLVLRYGDSAIVKCEVCGHQGTPKFEKSLGKVTGNNTTAVWIIEKMTEWDITSICYYEDEEGKLQTTILPVVVYQLPEHVSISFVEYNNALKSGKHTRLLCSVSDTAPAADLVVTFYRGSIPLDQQNSTRTTKEPESQSFTLIYNITKKDNGAPFWCQAKLELGHEGPQHLPVVRSGNINPIVHYKPELLVPANPDPIKITEGKSLHLNCSADGNPAPSYTWEKPIHRSNSSSSVLTVDFVSFEHMGQYVCTVSNSMGSVKVKFNVDVQGDHTPFIIAAAVFFVVLMIVGGLMLYHFCYKPNRMGTYSLWNVLNLHKQHTAVPAKD